MAHVETKHILSEMTSELQEENIELGERASEYIALGQNITNNLDNTFQEFQTQGSELSPETQDELLRILNILREITADTLTIAHEQRETIRTNDIRLATNQNRLLNEY